MGKIVECYISDIPIGSHITEDIFAKSGALLVKNGTEITERVHRQLQNYKGRVKVEVNIDFKLDYSENDTIFKISDSVKERTLESARLMYNSNNTEIISKSAIDITDTLVENLRNSKSAVVSLDELKISDEYTFKHSVDVGAISMIVAQKLGGDDKFVKDVALAGVLHDLGKSKIPLNVLNKPGRLEGEEWEIMKRHPYYSYMAIKDTDDISNDVKTAVLEHHENFDGSGYPLGLSGNKICRIARILSVADVYAALVTERPYKEAKTPATAMEIIMGMAHKFELEMLNTFTRCIILYPVGSIISLSNGTKCIVIKNNNDFPLRPVCQDLDTGEIYDLLRDTKLLSVVIS